MVVLQSITILVLIGCIAVQEMRINKLSKELNYLYENQEVGK